MKSNYSNKHFHIHTIVFHSHKILLLFACFLLTFCTLKSTSKASPEIAQALDSKSPLSNADCFNNENTQVPEQIDTGVFTVKKAQHSITIDGCAQGLEWDNSPWYSLNYLWIGSQQPDSNDYYGKFKVLWDEQYLYILVNITDDVRNETLIDGVENYWRGDMVELFLDEDLSGGNHQYNHQAFAYHVTTDGQAIDKNSNKETAFYNDHLLVGLKQQKTQTIWEMAFKIYDKDFKDSEKNNIPVVLIEGKEIGLSLAYGDNDGKHQREHFMGSKESHGINNDEGYIRSGVFGKVILGP